MTEREIRDINHEKGFSTKFIMKFDRDWAEVVLAAQKLKRKRQGRIANTCH